MIYRPFAFLTILFLVFAFCNCDEDTGNPTIDPPSTSKNKIMPLGASRVEGARPIFESFRYELWKDLVDGGWEFDYIGTQDDSSDYPTHSNTTFDVDHEGRGGWTSGQILNGLGGWLASTGVPDIVLFSSPGGNDALQNLSYEAAIDNINAIIDELQAANPAVTIIMEQLAPGRSDIMVGDLANYFSRMQQDLPSIADAQTTTSSRVIAVDMFTDFNDTLLADDVHYNEAGAQFIADRYYQVLQGILQE